MVQQHIDSNTLSMLVKTSYSPDANSMESTQYHEVLDHLANCVECREQVTIITTLQNEWPHLRHQSSLTEEQQQNICDYIDGKLQANESAKIKALINTRDDAKKAALHYQSHTETMANYLTTDNVFQLDSKKVSVKAHSQGSIFANMLTFMDEFFSIRSPMIFTMAATSALFVAVILLVQLPVLQQNQTIIASYQDDPTIQFTAKSNLPGIGFFTQSANISKPFDNVRIQLISENVIKITWPVVDGAKLYKMRIQVFNQGEKALLKETSTQSNHAIFQLQAEQHQDAELPENSQNTHYEWVLYGNTTDNSMFYAAGGFVIGKSNSDRSNSF